MKSLKFLVPVLLILIIVTGILILSAFGGLSVSAAHAQVNTTPTPQDNSVVGSTDGIVGMGFLIVLIVLVPLVFLRKRK